MDAKIRVLTVNCVLSKGSTGKIIDDIVSRLFNAYDFILCYAAGDKPACMNEYRVAPRLEMLSYYVLGRLLGLKYCTGYTSTFRLLRYIKKQKPDIVHLHCPNINAVNIPWVLRFLKKNRIPTVVTNHAEFYYTGNCPHAYECLKFQTGCGQCDYVFDPYRKYLFDRTAYEWKKMKDAFDGFEKLTMVAVSPWVQRRMLLSPIVKGLHTVVVKNGVDCENTFHPVPSDLKHQLGIVDSKKVLLHVTANFTDQEDDLKGGRFIIELAKKIPEIDIIVVGPYRLVHPELVSDTVRFIGAIADQTELAKYYSMADLTVITSRRETFGMVCAESLCCGTPIVGFCAGGPESIALPAYSSFVPYGDIDALYGAVLDMIDKKTEEISSVAGREYSCDRMAEEYRQVYQDLLKSGGSLETKWESMRN